MYCDLCCAKTHLPFIEHIDWCLMIYSWIYLDESDDFVFVHPIHCHTAAPSDKCQRSICGQLIGWADNMLSDAVDHNWPKPGDHHFVCAGMVQHDDSAVLAFKRSDQLDVFGKEAMQPRHCEAIAVAVHKRIRRTSAKVVGDRQMWAMSGCIWLTHSDSDVVADDQNWLNVVFR